MCSVVLHRKAAREWGVNVREMVDEGRARLPKREGLPDPRREARWLLARAWGVPETWLRLHPGAEAPAEVVGRFRDWIERRALGEPAHHLTGTCPFWNRDFIVSPAVLIPRPETELIVATVLEMETPKKARLLDVGTGSGCLAVTFALERPEWWVTATDLSGEALIVAGRNAARLGARVRLVRCDLATAIRGSFDVIVANLPYVRSSAMPRLPVEVHHDPPAALDGGAGGLELIARLVTGLPRLLASQGIALLEIGEGQVGAVEALVRGVDLVVLRRLKDLGGCERVIVLGRMKDDGYSSV